MAWNNYFRSYPCRNQLAGFCAAKTASAVLAPLPFPMLTKNSGTEAEEHLVHPCDNFLAQAQKLLFSLYFCQVLTTKEAQKSTGALIP